MLPRALTWEEVEAGKEGQLPLPGVGECPTLAERAFLVLARNWQVTFKQVPLDSTPPRQADLSLLAALLIAVEHGERFTEVARSQIRDNLELASGRGRGAWLDYLPWSLADASRFVSPELSYEVRELVANLIHHKSEIRVWMMEVGWVVRPWLRRESAMAPLLENVASTLIGVELAWGLAATLFDSAVEFQHEAECWIPSDFKDQYGDRLLRLKDSTLSCQAPFWELETSLRKAAFEATFPSSDVPSGSSTPADHTC
jgi:hypothetical protein